MALQITDSYKQHKVFDEIEHMKEIYEFLSYSCSSFLPTGTKALLNYAAHIYDSLVGTLDSVKMLLEVARIKDVHVLVRTMYDDVLIDLYMDLRRKEVDVLAGKFFVEDVDKWLYKKFEIPRLKRILKTLQTSEHTKELYSHFGWNTYLKRYRGLMDDFVHSNRFVYMMYNCNQLYLEGREKYLNNISVLLKELAKLHLSFLFYLHPEYFMASDYLDYSEMGLTPPVGSENWIAIIAQEAFDRYIKPQKELADFIRQHCALEIS